MIRLINIWNPLHNFLSQLTSINLLLCETAFCFGLAGKWEETLNTSAVNNSKLLFIFFHMHLFYPFLMYPRDTPVTLLILSRCLFNGRLITSHQMVSLPAASALIKTPIEPIPPPCMRTRLVQVKYRAADRQSGQAHSAKIKMEVQQNTPTLLTSIISFCIFRLILHLFVFFKSEQSSRAAPSAV